VIKSGAKVDDGAHISRGKILHPQRNHYFLRRRRIIHALPAVLLDLAGEILFWLVSSTLCLRKRKEPIGSFRSAAAAISHCDFVAKIPIYFVPFISCCVRLPAYAAYLYTLCETHTRPNKMKNFLFSAIAAA
jgi:hypothetical protein